MIKALLTDIEGTTTSLSFVKDVLFPYARNHLEEFIQSNRELPQVRAQLAEVSSIVSKRLDDAQIVQQLIQWIDEDKKITPLKALQGMLWKTGYEQGAFCGHVYSDAVQQLQTWHQQGLQLYIFSSGSVLAQKLLFGHTEWGDLTSLFSGYFDTQVGSKSDPLAYSAIANAIHQPAENILFLSDTIAELDAAKSTGIKTIGVVRAGSSPSANQHNMVNDFLAIQLENF